MIDLKELGQEIKAQRKLKGLSKLQLAEKSGLSFHTIAKLEQGKTNITIGALNKVVNALEVKMYYSFE